MYVTYGNLTPEVDVKFFVFVNIQYEALLWWSIILMHPENGLLKIKTKEFRR